MYLVIIYLDSDHLPGLISNSSEDNSTIAEIRQFTKIICQLLASNHKSNVINGGLHIVSIGPEGISSLYLSKSHLRDCYNLIMVVSFACIGWINL